MQEHNSTYNDVLLDDYTYNTNCFGFPLLVFVGLDKEGNNIFYSFPLLNNETN